MKKLIIMLALAAPAIITGCQNAANENNESTADSAAAKEESAAATQAPPMDSAAMMKAWMDFATPGDVHKMMASWEGTWEGDITSWTSPDGPPTKSKGKLVQKMIMGGRYLEGMHSGDMMGMPFEGYSLMGYNNETKMFESAWADNMGTSIMMMTGNWDEASKSYTLKGSWQDPTTHKNNYMREVVKIIDDNHQHMEMYSQPEGGTEFKCMEIDMTKK